MARTNKGVRSAEDELRVRLGQQAAVAELGRNALAGAGVPTLLRAAVSLINSNLGADLCEVWELLDGGELLLRAGVGWDESLIGAATLEPDEGSLIGRALLGGEPVVVEDLREETRFKPPPLLVRRGVVSCMSVPVEGRVRPFGVVCAHSTKQRSFTSDDANFLKAVANVLASAIRRAEDENALRLGEERFSKAFRASPDVLVISRESDGTILEVNESWSALFGYKRAEVTGKSSLALNLFADAADREKVLAELRSRGAVRDYEVKLRRKSGETCDALLSIETLEVNGERCILSIVRDFTEQRRAEERIRQQAALLDVAQEAILVRDLEDRILYWNRGAERLYGWTAREALGRHVLGFIYSEPTQQFGEAQAVLLGRGEWSGEVRQVTKDGRDIIVESRWTLVRDERGSPRAKLVVNTDVTEKRRLEAELLRASHLSLIGELAAGLAHEIKNPLAGIKGAVDILIKRREEGDAEITVLEDVRHAVERIDKTVVALLQRARPRQPQFAAASLDEVAHRAVLLARHYAEKASSQERQVSIFFEPASEPIMMPIDAAQIEDAVLNLILNGVAAVDGDGRVFVCVKRERPCEDGAQDEAVIEVRDTGRGIAAEDLARVFSPFYTTTEGGTGLGLPSVRRIARAHGGRVEVISEQGRGSTFAIHLPLPAET